MTHPLSSDDTLIDHAPLLERAFPDELEEIAYSISSIEGELPADLAGVYYLNGPARFRRGDVRYRHWLDGDGMVAALHLAGGRAHWTQRYVDSHKRQREEAPNRARFRAFGTTFEGAELERGLALASPVNVSVYPWRGTLLAFGEQGLPWELDPSTLATRGEHRFDGRLNALSPFSAHPCFDPESGEMFNFGVSFSASRPSLNLYRFGADGTLAYRRRHELPWPCSIHDFALTGRFAVIHVSPYLLDMEALTGGRHLLDALSWQPDLGSSIWLLDRETGELVHQTPVGRGYCLHLIHAADHAGTVHVDLLEMDEPVYDQYRVPDLFPDTRTARAARYSIDATSGALTATDHFELGMMCDFPAIDPRAGLGSYEEFTCLGLSKSQLPGRKFFDTVARYRWGLGEVDRWEAPPCRYLGGEPVFLPAAGGGGYTLCQEFDAREETMRLLLFDAHRLAAGPVAALALERPMHLGFHACWQPAGAGV